MRTLLWSTLAGVALWAAPAAADSIIFFEGQDFTGPSIVFKGDAPDFGRVRGWNDRAGSVIVRQGSWSICRHARYNECITLPPGSRIQDLGTLRLDRQVSSVRLVRGDGFYGQPPYRPPPPRYPWDQDGRRGNDRVVWDDDRRRDGNGFSQCQERVYAGFVERYGYRAPVRFRGGPDEGVIVWNGDRYQFQCRRGRVNVWQ